MTCLHNCIDVKKLQELINLGTDVNIKEMQELINLGADVNVKNDKGNTPLQVICWNASFFTCMYIGNVSKDEIEKNPIYHITTYIELAKLLIESGADVNVKGRNGSTPLHISLFSTDLTKLLIESGADVNVTDYDGSTPLRIGAF
jgi:ankyrin repeat protein